MLLGHISLVRNPGHVASYMEYVKGRVNRVSG